jgi:DNA/RNA endonuclease YhcR with UshA esterase domain
MRKTLFIVFLSAGVLLAARSAHAHHSFAAEFDINKPVTLTGVLTKMDWVNPHGWMRVDVTAADGTVEHWSIQTGGPTQLLRRGLGKETFPAGIEVTIRGFRSRAASPVAHAETVTLKDGRNFFIGEIPIT